MIDVTDVTVRYKVDVLDRASFSVEPGTLALLTGPNGAGKTSMLRVIAGRCSPASGRVTVDGIDVEERRTDAQERLAFLPQDVHFHEALTPRQVIRFYAGVRGVSDPPADTILDDVGLASSVDRPCGELSGGMRQRLGVAVIQMADVPVLLLDEPERSLDRRWRRYLQERLKERATDGASILVATHHPEIWADAATTRLFCDDGTIERGESVPGSAARRVGPEHDRLRSAD